MLTLLVILAVIAVCGVATGGVLRFLFYGSAEAVGRLLGEYDKRRARQDQRRLPPGPDS